MLNRIKTSIDGKRNSDNIFWKILVFFKDIIWYFSSIKRTIYTLFGFGLYDIVKYSIFEHPIISPKEYKFLADSKNLPEFDGGIFNPGSLNLGKKVVLLARGEKYLNNKRDNEHFANTCSPVSMFFTGGCLTNIVKIKINHLQENNQRTEDFRLFEFKGKIFSNFSLTKWDSNDFFIKNNPKFLNIKMMIGELNLDKNELSNLKDIKIDSVLNRWEKNWVFFEIDNNLYLIYSFSPNYRLLKLNDEKNWEFAGIINKKTFYRLRALTKSLCI